MKKELEDVNVWEFEVVREFDVDEVELEKIVDGLVEEVIVVVGIVQSSYCRSN